MWQAHSISPASLALTYSMSLTPHSHISSLSPIPTHPQGVHGLVKLHLRLQELLRLVCKARALL